ncbi:hypothetical protein J416_11005 [Gracilibacillus halophilus YIM-C55.5]|uniref:Uncharacterized protein n=1 Tax=Gracilibacillus halophilus YIM-C55.5 TaxID=1308866 RepID=N4WJM1_9BACI|nr:hypothetical protein [Gracilibacillus halophilus]ENH96367.1 hypothetical protein J416_11005 [Gracilibacillus halophilus YIM-C55.5]
MKKLLISALVLIFAGIGFYSHNSSDDFTAETTSLRETTTINDNGAEVKFAALANGLKFWGKEATKMFLDNGGLASTSSKGLDFHDLDSAFDR